MDSPAVVVATEYGQSARAERMNKVQDSDPSLFQQSAKVLEINPNHPVIHDLLQKVKADPEDESCQDAANLVAQAAVLQSAFDLEDPEILVNSIYELVSSKHGLDPKAEPTPVEVVLPEEPKTEEEDDDIDEELDEEEGTDGDKPEL